MNDRLLDRTSSPGSYRDVLRVAFPLALSTGSWAVMHFVDRMFLSRYSVEALAAAVPGSAANFCLVSVFLGTATYVNAFIAQYIGAGKPREVGSILWQGVYFSLASGILVLGGILLAGPLFRLIGHVPAVQEKEVQYFRILCYGTGAAVLGSTLSCFFIGRGKTVVVMVVNATATTVNILLDYAWIFGNWGFPRAGIRGAGYATVAATVVRMLLYLTLVLLPANRRTYATWKGWKLNPKLFRRLLRFGLPSGVQLMLEILGFTLFVLFVGRISKEALAATNVAFNINSLAFTPMLGFAFAVSTLVGQYLGANRPDLAQRSANSTFRMASLYAGTFALTYLTAPRLFVQFFGTSPEAFEPIGDTVVILLRFVAAYSIFDVLNIVYAHGLKGAGDTRFVMWASVILSWVILVMPSYLICVVLHGSIYTAWFFMTAYVIVLGLTFYRRFRGGKWKSMRVIEAVPGVPEPLPEFPTVEVEFGQRVKRPHPPEPHRRHPFSNQQERYPPSG